MLKENQRIALLRAVLAAGDEQLELFDKVKYTVLYIFCRQCMHFIIRMDLIKLYFVWYCHVGWLQFLDARMSAGL